MAEYKIDQATLDSVRGKVVVLTGGAQGIGAATVTQLYHSSAHIVFCDWNDKAGSSLVEHLKSSVQSDGSVVCMKVDVRDYQTLWSMFDATYAKHGRIDMAICCAGVTEQQGYFEPDKLNLESAKEIPTGLADVLDINLKGTLYFARLAVAYLKENHTFDAHSTGDELSSPKCITFVSSVAGFISAPTLYSYASSKHGVMGLMRALRVLTLQSYGLRVNAICPWATDTQLFSGIRDEWNRNKMPMNTPEHIAGYIIQATADPKTHGKALYVAGGNAVDIEEGIWRLEPQWLGEKNSRDLKVGNAIMGLDMDWGNTGGDTWNKDVSRK